MTSFLLGILLGSLIVLLPSVLFVLLLLWRAQARRRPWREPSRPWRQPIGQEEFF